MGGGGVHGKGERNDHIEHIETISPRVADSPVVVAPGGLVLVKDAVTLVQVAQFWPEVVMHIERLYWFPLHGDVPDLSRRRGLRAEVRGGGT